MPSRGDDAAARIGRRDISRRATLADDGVEQTVVGLDGEGRRLGVKRLLPRGHPRLDADAVLLPPKVAQGVADGSVTLAFRRWRKQDVKPGAAVPHRRPEWSGSRR